MSSTRREFLRRAAIASGVSYCPWLPQLALHAAAEALTGRPAHHVILLWMTGGPSQLDTFDLKPGHPHGGEFKEIATTVPGIKICEHLPKLAAVAQHLAIVRSLTTKEGDHARGTYLIHTGQRPGGPLRYPALGATMAKALGDPTLTLPSYVSVTPALQINPDAYGPGFLGPRYAPAIVQRVASPTTAVPATNGSADPASATDDALAELGMENLKGTTDLPATRAARRFQLWDQLQSSYLESRSHPTGVAHDTVYRKAFALAQSQHVEAFDLSQEPLAVRESFGRGVFGQGCLIARRLVERGVPFVEVALGTESIGWDTHADNFATVKKLCGELDLGWSQLINDLQARGLLESTTILWIGEFGRTPVINPNAGRDHFPAAWSCVLAGGGIRGGQVYGQTTTDGMAVAEHPVQIADVLATVCRAAGLDPAAENLTATGRPVKLAEGEPIAALL